METKVTETTSDDTHLAAGRLRYLLASGYAPKPAAMLAEEQRIASDGQAYTFAEFVEFYDEQLGQSKWEKAQVKPPEPAPPPEEPIQEAAINILLSPETAQEIRDSTRIPGTGKKEMRAFLDETANSNPLRPNILAFDIPGEISWRHYVARHQDWKRIVGTGITKAQLRFITNVHDPNRNGQLRLDYVFENLDGECCHLHPGNKGKDAKPIFRQIP